MGGLKRTMVLVLVAVGMSVLVMVQVSEVVTMASKPHAQGAQGFSFESLDVTPSLQTQLPSVATAQEQLALEYQRPMGTEQQKEPAIPAQAAPAQQQHHNASVESPSAQDTATEKAISVTPAQAAPAPPPQPPQQNVDVTTSADPGRGVLLQPSSSEVKKESSVDCSKHQDYLEMARCLHAAIKKQKTLDNSNDFLILIMSNKAFLPFIFNWLCNTAHMEGVHERTLFLFTDDGDMAIRASQFTRVHAVQVDRNLANEFQADQDYDTYGYWKLVQVRVQAIVNIMKADIPILICEPDALWVKSPLKDPALTTGTADLVGFDDNSGVPGFGFLRVRTTAGVKALFDEMERRYSSQMPQNPPPLTSAFNPGAGEQDILHGLIADRQSKPWKDLQFQMLPGTKYASGKWYDGGRGGDGKAERENARKEGVPFVINNNWIVGNQPKIVRAKRWGHWFLQDDTAGTCKDVAKLNSQIQEMQKTMESLQPMHGPPKPGECPKCR